ncbi:M23 family metallopeptidase, partial [Actinoalloteichus caeruleus]
MYRRLAALVAAVAISAVGLVINQGEAQAAPNFRLPFECGETVTANTRANHSPAQAIDFQRGNINGLPVVASAAGTVSRVENTGNTSYGRWIEINHGDGWRSRYAHLSSQAVSVGQRVTQGQRIGNVGSTGGSTGPHLHYEHLQNGSPVRINTIDGQRITYYGNTTVTACGGGNPYT